MGPLAGDGPRPRAVDGPRPQAGDSGDGPRSRAGGHRGWTHGHGQGSDRGHWHGPRRKGAASAVVSRLDPMRSPRRGATSTFEKSHRSPTRRGLRGRHNRPEGAHTTRRLLAMKATSKSEQRQQSPPILISQVDSRSLSAISKGKGKIPLWQRRASRRHQLQLRIRAPI